MRSFVPDLLVPFARFNLLHQLGSPQIHAQLLRMLRDEIFVVAPEEAMKDGPREEEGDGNGDAMRSSALYGEFELFSKPIFLVLLEGSTN